MKRLAMVGWAFWVGCASAPRSRDAFQRALHPTSAPRTQETPGAEPSELSAGPLRLSAEDAVLLALENNRDLRVQRFTPQIVGAFEQIEAGVFDPELFAEFDYRREKTAETARATGDLFDVDARGNVSRLGVRQQFSTGTRVEGVAEHRFSASNRTPDQQSTRLGLSLTQSMLRGFGPGATLAAVRAARLETAASVHELQGFVQALVAQTETDYWRYLLAVKQIEILERSLAIAQRQLDDVEQRIEVGTLAEIEVHASRAEVALRRQAMIEGRSVLNETRLRLLRRLGTLGNPNREVMATSPFELQAAAVDDIEDRVLLAERFRPDLKEALLRQEQRRLEVVATRNGLLPQLDFFVTLGKTGFADTFERSFERLDRNTFDLLAGIRLNYALGNNAAGGRSLAAQKSYRQAAEAIENMRELVVLDVRLAANEVERARQQISASAATRQQQERTVAAETERFTVGVGTALRVALAQRDLLASEIAEVKAIVDYRTALVQLHLAEGTLLERRGLELPAQGARALP